MKIKMTILFQIRHLMNTKPAGTKSANRRDTGPSIIVLHEHEEKLYFT